MSTRRAGLQGRWGYVVNSLQQIVPSYEVASRRISLYADRRMREEVVAFAVRKEGLVLDLGSGPGTLSKEVARAGGNPVLLDVSAVMLKAAPFPNRVQGTFEHLPFREAAFDAVVSGFAVRDSLDLSTALGQVRRVMKGGGRLALCDLGKPASRFRSLLIGAYLKVAPYLIGLATTGRAGLRYGSLYDTYALVLNNEQLEGALSSYFMQVRLHETQLGGSIVATCVR